ncbi:hypothetical protein PIB30_092203, partial [Stylosanthes scabra]|nr:hypothetical protein [Stylosanthes scabra]
MRRSPRICVQGKMARRSVRVDEQGVARICVGSTHMRGMPRKIEERKLADQETAFGSKTEQGSTHMRGRARICVLLIPQPMP